MHPHQLIEYEAVADPAETTAATDTVDASAGAVATPEPSAAAPDPAAPTEAPAPGGFDPNDPAVQQHLDALLEQRLAPIMQALAPQPEFQAPPPVPDPFSDNYQQEMERWGEYQRELAVAPYRGAIEAAHEAQVSQWVDGQLGDAMKGYPDVSGDPDSDRQAVLFSSAGFRQIVGDDSRAIREATQFMQARDQKIAQKAVNDYKQSLQGGNPAGRDPGVNGAAVSIEGAPRTYDDVMARYEGMSHT